MSKIMTFFEPFSGRAIVSLDPQTFHLLEVKDDDKVEGPRTLPTTFNMNAWIDVRHCETLHIDIGEYPLEPLQKYMLVQTRLHQLTSWFERSMNGTFTNSFRNRCAVQFERYFALATSEVVKEFRENAKSILAQPDIDCTNHPFKAGSAGIVTLEHITKHP